MLGMREWLLGFSLSSSSFMATALDGSNSSGLRGSDSFKVLRCLHVGAWCVQGSTLGTSLVCCWISSSRIKVPKQICLDMWMDLVLSRHKCFLVRLADDLLARQAMLHRLDMARKDCTANVFEPIYVVQGLQWSGDNGSGMAVRRRSGWARAQVGFAGFGMGLFGWIMSVVVLGSAVL
ncbi:hypothetical protein M0R45_036274 [Rubus argutus]|uniref:Secreted protein n=1 Tax=Rubus argutus TaxID=59490 RepID=A0AAW1VWH5_RUBAR